MRKLFTLLTLLVMCVTGAWAADYTVTATRVLSNSKKTCTWSAITANEGNAFQNSTTALGEGLYFVAVGKCTLNGGNSVNVKANGEMYIEVPSASSAGTVIFTNGVNDRYMQTVSGGKVHMKGDEDNGDLKASLAFTSSDIVDVGGVKYLKLTSKSDCKFGTVAITLTSEETYELGEAEITAIKICGVAISASDLSTLKSTHSLSVDGSTVNGMPGTLDVTVANGATTVTRTINDTGTTAYYAFTVNNIGYTVSITNVNESHTAEGSVVYYSKNEEKADGADTSELTANGITFTYPTKTLSYGSATVTMGSDTYTAIKLSTGEAVSVTFPEGKVATKVIVYGWSADGLTGYLSQLKESPSGNKSINVSSNKFYALNSAEDIYPTVYEYDLANWESAYFQGSGAQPFVIMDFVLVDAPIVTLPTGNKSGYTCNVNTTEYSRTNHPFDKQSVYTISNGSSITLTVPSTTQITKIQVLGTSDDNSNASTITITGTNDEKASGTFENRNTNSLSMVEFTPTTQTTTYTISSANKSSVVQVTIYGEELVLTPKKQYTTLTSAYNLDFTNVDGLNAYIVKADGVTANNVTLTQVKKVPAGTGLILKGTPDTEYTLATYEGEGDDISGNKMVGSATAETEPVTDAAYILSNGAFHPWSGTGKIAAGKAYLNVNIAAGAKALTINFADETGINNATAAEANNAGAGKRYNLAGQLVGENYKGIVIENGKKFNQ